MKTYKIYELIRLKINMENLTNNIRNRKSQHSDTYLLPHLRYLCVVHAVECVSQILGHDDRSVDGELEVVQGRANCADDSLHAIDLLLQEDVHWLEEPGLRDFRFHFERDVVAR